MRALSDGRIDDPTSATKAAVKSVAPSYQALAAEVRELEVQLDRLTSETDPLLRSRFGVGPDSAKGGKQGGLGTVGPQAKASRTPSQDAAG